MTKDGLVTSANTITIVSAKTEVFAQTCKEITPVTAATLGTEADSVKN